MPGVEKGRRVNRSEQGKWFLTIGYWLLPATFGASRSQLEKKPTESTTLIFPRNYNSLSGSTHPKKKPKSHRQAFAWRVRKNLESLMNSSPQYYNSQPVWSLKELGISPAQEARSAADEFLEMVRKTSGTFCWPLNDPKEDLMWRVHGWKHISYRDMAMFWLDHASAIEPAANRAFALGSDNEIRELFLAAAGRDAEAVGIIWTQFPKVEDQEEIIEHFLHSNDKPGRIPHPSELASELVDVIFARPESEEADHARSALMKLASVSVRRGSRSKRGRPKIRIPSQSLRLLWKMGYCLVRQVLELNDFLALYKELERDRLTIVLNAYPWINRITRKFDDFLSFGPSRASLEIVGRITEMSASSLEKMGIRSPK